MVAFGEYVDDGTASAMKARDWKDATDLVAQPMMFKVRGGVEREDGSRGSTNVGRQAGKGFLGSTERAFTVASSQDQWVAQPIHYRKSRRAQSVDDHETWVEDEATNTLNCFDVGDVRAVDVVAQPVAFDWQSGGDSRGLDPKDTAQLQAHQTPAVLSAMAVRRLTPTECERLQGFPDGYTNIKENCPDGPRYKALGNSMAVPVMRWIGERIKVVDTLCSIL